MELKVTLTLERETKGAVRYQEVNELGEVLELQDSVIGTLYLRKSGLPKGIKSPKTLEVTVRAD